MLLIIWVCPRGVVNRFEGSNHPEEDGQLVGKLTVGITPFATVNEWFGREEGTWEKLEADPGKSPLWWGHQVATEAIIELVPEWSSETVPVEYLLRLALSRGSALLTST